jgi:molybdopterin-guanine dinucleotide biosynthesis protein A
MDSLRLGAVVLAGGTAARMGGVDKASIELDGVTLLERALAATMSAQEVVVVGLQVPTTRPVTWTMEDPASGGPAAGLLTALDRFLVAPDLVAVLAVDMPRVHAGTMARLRWAIEADSDVDGAVLVDTAGREQPLAAIYRHSSLFTARPASYEDQHGLAMRRLIGPLRLAGVSVEGDEAHDIDTWDDLRRLRDPGCRTNLGP